VLIIKPTEIHKYNTKTIQIHKMPPNKQNKKHENVKHYKKTTGEKVLGEKY